MGANSRRRFTVLDGLALIAALGLGLAALRRGDAWPDFTPVKYTDYLVFSNCLFFFVAPCFASVSLAVFLLSLQKPRPSLRRLIRQPGFVACTAAVTVLVIRMLNLIVVIGLLTLDLPMQLFGPKQTFWGWLLEVVKEDDIRSVPSDIGCAIAAAWVIQAIGGRWRPEPQWIDRMGRLLGTIWIVAIPLSWFTSIIGG